MFNLSGSELIFLVLIALVVLGPDKLPEAMRKAGKAYADFKKMTTGFQSEMKSVLEEPMRELRETAELAKKSAMWDVNATPPDTPEATKPVSGNMADHEPSDAAKRRMERATPPDLTVSTAPLPVVSSAETETEAEVTEPMVALAEMPPLIATPAPLDTAAEPVVVSDDADGVPSA